MKTTEFNREFYFLENMYTLLIMFILTLFLGGCIFSGGKKNKLKRFDGTYIQECERVVNEQDDSFAISSVVVIENSKMYLKRTSHHNGGKILHCTKDNILTKAEIKYVLNRRGIHNGATIIERKMVSYKFTPLYGGYTQMCNANPDNCDGVKDWVTGKAKELINIIKKKQGIISYITLDIADDWQTLYLNKFDPKLKDSNPDVTEGREAELFTRIQQNNSSFNGFALFCIILVVLGLPLAILAWVTD